MKLILLRHLQSQWNFENRFSGWVDVPLSKEGIQTAEETARKLSQFQIETAYTSPLIRNLDTVVRVFEGGDKYPIFRHFEGKMAKWGHFAELDRNYLPVYVSESLNERYYGDLQGLNKEETIKKYGSEQVQLWRRGFNNDPPGSGEGLDEVLKRTTPFYKKYVEKDLKQGKNVLIVASHNSLRAIVKYVEKIADKDVISLEIPFGGLIVYDFDQFLKLLDKQML